MSDPSSNRITCDVVIAGGGFAGAYCAKYLAREWGISSEKSVALVAEDNVLAFQPMLAEVVGASLSPLDIVTPLREFCRGTDVLQGKVIGFDLEKKLLELDAGRFTPNTVIEFKHLVLALGGVIDLSRVPGMTEHGYILKNTWDAVRLRVALLQRIEEANLCTDAAAKRRLLTFVVVGGGYSGVETAGQILDLVRDVQPLYSNLEGVPNRVVLVHGRDFLLPEIGEKLGRYAEKKLRTRGMEILLNERVDSVSSRQAHLGSGRAIETHTVISTVGNTAHPLMVDLCAKRGLEHDHGRVRTEPTMLVKGYSDLWAIGDCAVIPNGKDPSCPPTAQFALRQGMQAGANIARAFRHEPLRPFSHRSQGQLASIGHRIAVADIFGLKFSGFTAWFVWRTIYLVKLPSFQRQVRVMIDWTLDLFFPRNVSILRPEETSLIRNMHFEKDEIIVEEKDAYVGFYIIKQGRLNCFRDGTASEQLGESDYLGGQKFSADDQWTVRAVASEPSTLAWIDRKVVKTLMSARDISERLQPNKPPSSP